jgi:hypothetical protein
MGLAEPHLAAYAQYVNLGFTMRRLYQSAYPQTRYDPPWGIWDQATTVPKCAQSAIRLRLCCGRNVTIGHHLLRISAALGRHPKNREAFPVHEEISQE